MFKQLKSALLWFYLIKFRRSLSLMAFLGLVIFFANSIYADLVDYLRFTDQIHLLKYAVIIKWLIIFSACLGIFRLAFHLIKQLKPQKAPLPVATTYISPQERQLREKHQLTSHAEQIIQQKIKQKSRQ